MRRKLPVLILALIILLQFFIPSTFAVSKNETISLTPSFCSLDTTPEGAGKASKYDDITSAGSRYINKSTNVTKSEFGANLSKNGWTKSVSKDGKTIIYQKNGAKYVLRDGAKSTGGPTADYYEAGSKSIDIKIRLGEK